MKVGFAIVTHNSEICPTGNEDTIEFIKSIKDTVKYDHEIFLIDNESSPRFDSRRNVEALNYTFVEDQSIGGVTAAWNLAVNAAVQAGCDIINLCNNDLLFTKSINNYVKKIIACPILDSALFGPITNLGGAPGHFQETIRTEGNKTTEVTHIRIGLNGFMMSFGRELYERHQIAGNLFATDKRYRWDAQEHELRFRLHKSGGREFVLHDSMVLHKKNKSWLTAKKKILGINNAYWNPDWDRR